MSSYGKSDPATWTRPTTVNPTKAPGKLNNNPPMAAAQKHCHRIASLSGMVILDLGLDGALTAGRADVSHLAL